MITDRVTVDGRGVGRDDALGLAEKFSGYEQLDRKSALRIRLLTEEMLGMVTEIAEDFNAQFWIESEGNKAFLHLMADTEMNLNKKQEFIDASKRKKNDAGVGVMGKIREIVENSMYVMDKVGTLQAEYGEQCIMYSSMGVCEMTTVEYMWSLETYRASVKAARDNNTAAEQAWDELEKSIVANLADDVRVSVKGNKVELVIEKKFV